LTAANVGYSLQLRAAHEAAVSYSVLKWVSYKFNKLLHTISPWAD